MITNVTKTPVKSNDKFQRQIEEVKALFDSDALLDTGIHLRRMTYGGKRNYFSITEENRIDKIYTSVTTFVKEVLPVSFGLLDWMKNKSKEEQENILKSSATYGTLMDIFCNELLINGEVKNFEARIMEHTLREGLYYINTDQWTESLKKDVLAFAQFVQDYEVKPIMISAPLKSDSLGLAGTLDLYCEMNSRLPTKTIKPERIKAIIDYKAKIGDMSGKSDRNSFYESELMQLYIYALLLADNFPKNEDGSGGIEVDEFVNFSPKNWKTSPGYNLKIWSEDAFFKVHSKFDHYLNIFRTDNADKSHNIMIFEDEIKLNDFNKSYESIPLVDFVNRTLAKEVNNG